MKKTPILVALLVSALPAAAQMSRGGAPASLVERLRRVGVPTEVTPPVDVVALRAEDAARDRNEPARFAQALQVDHTLENSGTWDELQNGGRVWRLRIQSRGAHSLMLRFARFQLPDGATLFAYDDDLEYVRGAFTTENTDTEGGFTLSPTPGDALTLEYYEPAGASPGELELATVLHDYVDVLEKTGGLGSSDTCEIDIECPEGMNYQDQSRSVVRILGATGTCCSGVLLNNTNGDRKPYVITANHCGGLNGGTFQFNFRRPQCGSGTPTNMFDTVSASALVASSTFFDYQLLLLNDLPDPSYNAYYAGWDWTDTRPSSAVAIHHPLGDAMKIAVENNSPPRDQTFWRINAWEAGVTEGGSSGSPLFDQNGRVVGQLKGGNATCADPTEDYFGRFARQWSEIRPFLDALNSGVQVLDGVNAPVASGFACSSLVPSVSPPLTPGIAQTMRITGTGFTPVSTVAVDGVPLPIGTFTFINQARIDMKVPPLTLGTHQVEVTESGATCSATLFVYDPHVPLHQAGTGEPNNVITAGSMIPLYNSDTPGHTNVTIWSTSNIPSMLPRVQLLLGNNFTQIMQANLVTIPASGLRTDFQQTTTDNIGMTVYSQSLCPSCPFPSTGVFPVSGLQSTCMQ